MGFNTKSFTHTVVLATFNRAHKLREALNNYLINSDERTCFLVIDNNSQDSTKTVVESFEQKRIFYHQNQINVGGSRNYFIGISMVQTPICTLMADDDLVTPMFFSTLLDHFLKENLDLLHGFPHLSHNEKFGFRYYNGGLEAVKDFYMLAGALPGLTFRKSAFSHESFTLDKSIYPQISMCLDIVSRAKSAIYDGRDFGVIIANKIEIETLVSDRPPGFGMEERLKLAEQFTPIYSKQYFSMQFSLFKWFCSITEQFYQRDKNGTLNLINSTLENTNITKHPLFWFLFYKSNLIRKLNDKIVKTMIGSLLFSVFRITFHREIIVAFMLLSKKVLKISSTNQGSNLLTKDHKSIASQ